MQEIYAKNNKKLISVPIFRPILSRQDPLKVQKAGGGEGEGRLMLPQARRRLSRQGRLGWPMGSDIK